MEKVSKRIPAIDNLRAIMIFCVVAGHLLEFIKFENSGGWYDVIYTFHMPVFAFLSGLCCKSSDVSGRQLWRNVVWPYLAFQAIYLLVSNFIWHVEQRYQFTQPYWILWYLMAMFHWRIMLVMTQAARSKWIAFLISLTAALLVGYDISIGYFLTLSRAIVLFPFFFAGFCAREHQESFENFLQKNRRWTWLLRIGALVLGIGLTLFVLRISDWLKSEILWHAYVYSENVGFIGERALVVLLGFLWLAVFVVLTPRWRIPLLTYIGQNTMPVFVLHGFVMRGLSYNWELWHELPKVPFFLLLLVATPIVFSLKPVVFLSRPLMRWPFGKKV